MTDLTRRLLRGLQIFGLSLGALALGGTALLLSSGQAALAAPPDTERPELTVLVAGRDVAYCGYHQRCEDQTQRTGLFQPINTDTLMLVKVEGTRADILNIPRDTNVGEFDPDMPLADQKINSQYWQGGPDALVRGVERITGNAVDGYVVLNEDYVAEAIDRLGGLNVVIPEGGIQWTDNAAGIDLDLPAGPMHLDGREATLYLRVRKGFGDDWGRIDHQKQALTQLLARLRSPQGLAAIPGLLSSLGGSVETDLRPDQIAALTPHLPNLQLNFATLPTQPIAGTYNLAADWDGLSQMWSNPALTAYREEQEREQRGRELWESQWGEADAEEGWNGEGWSEGGGGGGAYASGSGYASGPEGTEAAQEDALPLRERPIVIRDGSGELLGPALGRALMRAGYTDVSVEVAGEGTQALPSQVLTLTESELSARLGRLLGVPRLQGERFDMPQGTVQIWLGSDAVQTLAGLLPMRLSSDTAQLRLDYRDSQRLLQGLSVPLEARESQSESL